MRIDSVTDATFTAEVLESEQPVLVDFWAAWCPPCRAMNPILDEIAAERDDLRIVKLDVDDNQAVAAQYGVLVDADLHALPERRADPDARRLAAPQAPRARARAGARAAAGRPVRLPAAGVSSVQPVARRVLEIRRADDRPRAARASYAGTRLMPSPARTRKRTVGGSPTSNSGSGLNPAACAAAITVSRSAVPGSARMNGRPRSACHVDRPPGELVVDRRPRRRSGSSASGVDRRRPRRLAVQREHGDVDRPALHQRDDLRRRALAQRDLDARVVAVEVRQRLGQPRRVGRRRRDPHDAARDAGVAVHVRPRPRDLGEHRLGVDEQVRARRVSSTPFDVRRNSVSPSSASSRRICCESAGWVT